MLLPRVQLAETRSAQRHLDEAGSVPAALSLHLVVAIGPRGIPFLALPIREQRNADRKKGEDQPERRDRARPVTIALVKAEQLDEHQDHFVVDTTIIKVRSVNEATDRTVSLPVPRRDYEGTSSTLGTAVAFPSHILCNRGLPDIDAELEKLAMNPWCAPQWVGETHLANEMTDFQRGLWTATARS